MLPSALPIYNLICFFFLVCTGNWMTYTFDENSAGIALRVEPDASKSAEASPSPPKESTSTEW